jgi:hypothetical protein
MRARESAFKNFFQNVDAAAREAAAAAAAGTDAFWGVSRRAGGPARGAGPGPAHGHRLHRLAPLR